MDEQELDIKNEELSSKEYTAEQNKKQNYDWLKGWQYVKGQSGNPSGRPVGRKSLKQFAKEYLEKLPDEEKIEFLKTLPSEIVWKMSEGNPKQDTDITSAGQPIPILTLNTKDVHLNNCDQENTEPDQES